MSHVSHSKYPQNFIDKLPHIHASFLKRFLVTFLDMLFVVIINIPIFLVLCRVTGGVTDSVNPPNIYNLHPKPITMLYFGFYMLFCCLIFFCVMPVYYLPQTLFSDLFNIKAVTLSGKKIEMHNFFKAYFVPVFLIIFANLALFAMACSSDKAIMYTTFLGKANFDKYWVLPVKFLFSAVVLIQLHYLVTVALSKNKRNWFTQAFDIVYIDIKKEKMFLSDIQDPNEMDDQTLLKGVNEDMIDDEDMMDEEYETSEDEENMDNEDMIDDEDMMDDEDMLDDEESTEDEDMDDSEEDDMDNEESDDSEESGDDSEEESDDEESDENNDEESDEESEESDESDDEESDEIDEEFEDEEESK